MGCDIHCKTYVRDARTGRMVSIGEMFEDGGALDSVVGDRDYDLFGAFGNSVRSWYPEFDCLKEGLPEFMSGTIAGKLAMDRDYHTRRHCTFADLKAEIPMYVERLKDPKKWVEKYGEGDDFYDSAAEGEISAEDYVGTHRYMIDSLENLLVRIRDFEDSLRGYFDNERDNRSFGGDADEKPDFGLDLGDIVLVTWMDN